MSRSREFSVRSLGREGREIGRQMVSEGVEEVQGKGLLLTQQEKAILDGDHVVCLQFGEREEEESAGNEVEEEARHGVAVALVDKHDLVTGPEV